MPLPVVLDPLRPPLRKLSLPVAMHCLSLSATCCNTCLPDLTVCCVTLGRKTARTAEPLPKPPAPAAVPTTPSPTGASPKLENVSQSSFNYLKVLGQGSFGKVLMAEQKSSKEVYAVKVWGTAHG